MKLIFFLLTIWFFYGLYRVIVKPLVLSLFMAWIKQQVLNKRPHQDSKPRQGKKYPYDGSRVVDAEFEEIKE